LSFLFPTCWTMNNVRCDRCHNRFYSDSVPEFCPKCTTLIPINITCGRCGIIENITPASFKKHDNMCIKCYNSVKRSFKCDYCSEIYVDTHNTYNTFSKSVCVKCRDTDDFKNLLLINYNQNHNESIDSILQISNFTVDVTYCSTLLKSTSTESNVDDTADYMDDKSSCIYDNIIHKIFTIKLPLIKTFTHTPDLITNPYFVKLYSRDVNNIKDYKDLYLNNYYYFTTRIVDVNIHPML
jgi:hypothetical protein